MNHDAFPINPKPSPYVIPAKAEIQKCQEHLVPGFRRGDGLEYFLRDHQQWKMICAQ